MAHAPYTWCTSVTSDATLSTFTWSTGTYRLNRCGYGSPLETLPEFGYLLVMTIRLPQSLLRSAHYIQDENNVITKFYVSWLLIPIVQPGT